MPSAPLADQIAAGRQQAVWFERPRFARLHIGGRDRASFLHNLTTNDVNGLAPGHGFSAAVVNQRAGVLDWVDLYAHENALWLVGGPERAASDLAWFDRYLFSEDVILEDLTPRTCLFYLTGPTAGQMLATLLPATEGLEGHGVLTAHMGAHPVTVMGTTGFHGAGYHLLAPAEMRNELASALDGFAVALDEAGYETLRIECGVPAHDRELTEDRNPWEARLDQSISLHKGCYLGQEIVARLDAYNKVQRYLVGLSWEAPLLVAGPAKLFDGEQEVGYVTSAIRAGEGQGGIALGYVKAAFAQNGQALTVRNEAGTAAAVVSARPFWQGKTRQGLAPSRQ